MKFTLLYPAERVVIYFTIFTFLLLKIFGLPITFAVGTYYGQVIASFQGYTLGLIICCIWYIIITGYYRKKKGLPPSNTAGLIKFRQLYLTRASIIQDIRFINCVMLMFVNFNYLKHLIPHINPNLYDLPILEFEKWLFAGLPSDHLRDLFGAGAAEFFSYGYRLFYIYNPLIAFVMIFQRKVKIVHEFFTAYILLWFLSIFMIYIWPTWGPCFFIPESYTWLP